MDRTFQLKKWEAYFNMIDLNNDGIVTLDAIMKVAEKITAAANVTLTEEIRQSCMTMFNTVAGKYQATFEELKDKLMKLDEQEDRIETMTRVGVPIFKIIDTNKDGVVSLKEYKIYMTNFGVSEEDAEQGFEAIDENRDGVISHEEFAAARAHFFFDKEDNKYKHFFGKFKQ